MRWHRRAIPYIAQVETADCGAAALAMALGYHGRHVSLAEMHEATGTGRDGIDALRIAEAADSYGLRARGVRTELDDLRVLPRGTVLHWGAAHFVVLESTSRRGVTIVDPAAGRYRLGWSAVSDLYSGVAIMLEPTASFAAGGRAAPGALHHARRLLTRSSGIGRVLATSVVVRVMALAVPVLTGVVVDQVVPAGDAHLLIVLAAVMVALIGYSVAATYLRAHLLLRLRSRLDVDMTLGFSGAPGGPSVRVLPETLLGGPDDAAAQQRHGPGDPDHRHHRRAARRRPCHRVSRRDHSPCHRCWESSSRCWPPPRSPSCWRRGGATSHLMGESLATEAQSQSYAYEMFSAVETLKAAGAERRAVSHWTNLFIAELNVSLRRGRLSAVVDTASQGLALLSPIAVLLVGANLVRTGQLSLGTMLALAALANGFLEPLATLVATALQIQLLGSYLARLDDVLNTPTETAGRDLRHAPALTGRCAPRSSPSITVRTAHRPSTAPISTYAPGRLWPSSGVPAQANPRWVGCCWVCTQPTSGRVLLDGIDLATLHPRSVRSQIGVVTQDPYIFGLSVRDNVAMGDPSSAVGTAARPPPSWPASPTTSTRCRWGGTPRSSTRAPHCRVVNVNGWPWPAHSRPGHASCCSTRPPAASTPSPRPRSTPTSPGSDAP